MEVSTIATALETGSKMDEEFRIGMEMQLDRRIEEFTQLLI